MAQFTQLAIRQTFLLLLEQTSLDKITVKMIVDACGISRNTFYYHYEDIPALLRDVLESELTRVCGPGGDGQPSPPRLQQLLSYVAQTEREFIKKRQAEGIAAAKAKGVRFGVKPKEKPPGFAMYYEQWQRGDISARAAAKALDVTHPTFLKWAKS